MAKTRRGKIIKQISNWRGTCPLCERKRVKLMWLKGTSKEGINICKACNAALTKK